MGYFDFMRRGRELITLNDARISSPFSPSEPSTFSIIARDIFPDIEQLPLTRAQAIAIPVVSRIRNLLVGLIAPLPLVALRYDAAAPEESLPVEPQPTFLYRSDSAVSPYERMAWTLDSILFYGCSLWWVTRGANGQIIDAQWIPQSQWTITNGRILVDEQPVDAQQVLLINSPFEGLLNVAQRTLRGAISLENAWTNRVKNPIPLLELKQTEDTGITQPEVDDYVASWASKHRSSDPSVGFTPYGMELREHGSATTDLFLEARNAIRTDIANVCNVPVSLVDGTSGTGSLTYKTTTGEEDRFRRESLPFWIDPIQQALSQDGVVPRGQRVRFDLGELDAAALPTGPVVAD